MTPTECRTLLAEMICGGRVDLAIQEKLEKTQSRIEPVLVETMLEYPDPLLREVAATILGVRRNPKAIPALLRALRDSSQHVRFDALVAIEKCAGLDPATLSITLRLDPKKPKQAVARVEAWWQIVRKASESEATAEAPAAQRGPPADFGRRLLLLLRVPGAGRSR